MPDREGDAAEIYKMYSLGGQYETTLTRLGIAAAIALVAALIANHFRRRILEG